MSELIERRVNTAMASGMVGLLAFMIARAAGVPIWYEGWVAPGDAADIGLTSTWACYFLISALKSGEAA